jgi:hypothetical protein
MAQPLSVQDLEAQLGSFAPESRQQALAALLEGAGERPPCGEVANMHCHSFFSFNAYGYSPSALAWVARQRGIPLMGIVDFDVLDGVEEFLSACQQAGVRASAAMETRAYIPEFGDREINSPGEPGVYYYMGIGFTRSAAPADVAAILAGLRARAEQRNRAMVARINAYLDEVQVDYERDVLTRTPAGNATERHMLAAYTQAAAEKFADPSAFWAEKLKMSLEQVTAQLKDMPTFQNTVRSKLMKRGGVGYVQPEAGSFPTIEEVNQLTVACGGLPCITWLDGYSAGEQAMEELMELLISKGGVALNIIPDRNWNIADPETRRKKVANLYQVVELAKKLDIPINVGTEMNAYGNKLVDDFDVPEMLPVRDVFIDGAYFIYGHTVMEQTLGLGYQSQWAKTHLPTRAARNSFYTRVGRHYAPTSESLASLGQLSAAALPDDFFK